MRTTNTTTSRHHRSRIKSVLLWAIHLRRRQRHHVVCGRGLYPAACIPDRAYSVGPTRDATPTGRSSFSAWTKLPWIDGKHVVRGSVVKGPVVLTAEAGVDTNRGATRPRFGFKITANKHKSQGNNAIPSYQRNKRISRLSDAFFWRDYLHKKPPRRPEQHSNIADYVFAQRWFVWDGDQRTDSKLSLSYLRSHVRYRSPSLWFACKSGPSGCPYRIHFRMPVSNPLPNALWDSFRIPQNPLVFLPDAPATIIFDAYDTNQKEDP
jgi:hypothetical protein